MLNKIINFSLKSQLIALSETVSSEQKGFILMKFLKIRMIICFWKTGLKKNHRFFLVWALTFQSQNIKNTGLTRVLTLESHLEISKF